MTILRPAQIQLMRQGRPVVPANFGGDSKSDSSTSTTNNITNHTDYNDKRNVAQDSAIALSGDGNNIDRSSTSVTQFFDSSDRSSTSLTSFTDRSNRSTNFSDSSNRSTVDNSNRSVSVRNTVTDHGAVAGAFDLMKLTTESGLSATRAAFDLAKSSGANSLAGSAAVLGFASDTIAEARGAFQEAEDGGQKTIALYALVVVGAIGVALALRN